MAVYLDSRKIEAHTGVGQWTDITSDVVSSIKATWGITGNSPLDRVAQTGTLTFDVNNADKKYTPGSTTYLSGFVKGTLIRLTLTFDGTDYLKFYGIIDNIKIQSGETGTRRATVSVVDWIEIASTYPLILPTSYTSRRADQGVSLIVNQMPIQPRVRDFAVTDDIFDIIFDVVKSRTRALAEFAKLIISEFGYLYLRKDKTYGETLVVEGRHDRDSVATQSIIPVSTANSSKLLDEDGTFILDEDGSIILCDETTTYDFDNTMLSLDTVYGKNFYNYVTVRNYPRYVGTSISVLYKINAPILLVAGETKTNLKGAFTDPDGGGTQINGQSMLAPVATTDYQMFQNSNGTGTDLTANLSVTATYGVDGVSYTITNNGATDGYVTKLQSRGYPVYIYNPVEQYTTDNTSILQNGYSELLVDQKYSPTLLPNIGLAQILLNQEKDARVVINKINLLANTSYEHMISFLNHDVGSLIKVVEDQTGTNNYFFIQQVTFEIGVNGIINYSYLLKEATSIQDSYWTLQTAGKSELQQTTFVSY